MKVCATVVGQTAERTGEEDRAIVMIDGQPVSELEVVEYRAEGLLNRRSVRVEVAGRVEAGRWLGRRAVVAWPVRLVDDSVRWPVLTVGVLKAVEREEGPGVIRRGLEIGDEWAERMDRPVEIVWGVDQGRLKAWSVSGEAPAMQIGRQANCSADRWLIHGRWVHVLEKGPRAGNWTVEKALESLSVWGGLELELGLLPAEIREAPLVREVDLSQPIGKCLERILQDYGLCIQRDLQRERGVILERRAVRPMERGRLVKWDWLAGAVLHIESEEPVSAAEEWIAEAKGWLVEGTFLLVKAWDRSLEGQADWIYSRVSNPDFATYANVYRRWALNEDGRYSGGVFGDQPAFDLSGFFGDPELGREAVRFEDCLTLDANGWPRRPIVEVSLDGGTSWSMYGGQVELEKSRAEVYLADATLPAEFLTAAKNGLARLRVTASLRNPRPVRISRWMGNPFEAVCRQRVLHTGEAFSFRRVHESSVHHALVRSGQCRADEVDDRAAMEKWLVEQIRRVRWAGGGGRGRGKLTTGRCWPLLRIGDRIRLRGGPREEERSAVPEKIRRQGAIVQKVMCRWSGWSAGGTRTGGPQTVVELVF